MTGRVDFNNRVIGRAFHSVLTLESWSDVVGIMVLLDYTTLRQIHLTFYLLFRVVNIKYHQPCSGIYMIVLTHRLNSKFSSEFGFNF